jgi:hypothetical protein
LLEDQLSLLCRSLAAERIYAARADVVNLRREDESMG